MSTTSAHDSETFLVDGADLRTQVRAALLTFVAPLAGVYGAATGTPASGDDHTHHHPRTITKRKKRA